MNSLPPEIAAELARLENDYFIEEEVVRGSNGVLFFARNRLINRAVAIKFYQGEPGEHQHDEPQLLAQVNSPYVLEILEARTIGNDWAFFITPRCSGGDLDDLMAGGVSARRALELAMGICAGVSAMHVRHLLHRDLKPANIVLDGDTPKIADFGSVRLIPAGADTVRASRHSVLYRPPESFGTDSYGRAGDVYQIGLVTYQLLGGHLPYEGTLYLNRQDRREYRKIEDEVDRQLFVNAAIGRRARAGTIVDLGSLPPWAQAARSVLRGLLHPDPTCRLQSASDAAAAMNQVRPNIRDWMRIDSGARLVLADRVVELRRQDGGQGYDVFVDTGSGFRHRKQKSGRSMKDLVLENW